MVRIKTTTGIQAQNTLQQYMKISLLTCLEALLGVISACLPVMKPVFRKLGAIGKPVATSREPINTPRSHRTNAEYPHISPPRQIVYEDSLHRFSSDLSTDVPAPSIPLPSFSWRPLTGFYLPSAGWEHDRLEQTQVNGNLVTTDWDIGRRRSEGDSPTLPWQTQWRSHHNKAMERC